jgi:aminoglycoside 6'-N-acetyltransferase
MKVSIARDAPERLCAEGAPLVAIDPAIDNVRARRAYEKAGFRQQAAVVSDEGAAVLMVYEPLSISSASPHPP